MPARSKRPAALLLAVGFGVGIVAAAIATGLGARAVSADVSATWIGPPTYPNGCAGGTFWGGAGECATIQNYGTWYGAYYGVSTSSGFSLGDIATSQVFCAEQPASGKWFPDPSYGYTEQNTPTTGEGAAWLDALAFAEGQQYHYDGGVVGSADQGEGTKLAIDYGLFGSTYGSPSSGWSGADSAAVTYADQLIAEANAMSGAQVGPNSWAYAVTDNTPSSTWQDGQPASIGFTLQSSNNVGVYDQPVTVTISGGTWDNGSNSVTVTTGNNAPGGNPAGNVPTLTFPLEIPARAITGTLLFRAISIRYFEKVLNFRPIALRPSSPDGTLSNIIKPGLLIEWVQSFFTSLRSTPGSALMSLMMIGAPHILSADVVNLCHSSSDSEFRRRSCNPILASSVIRLRNTTSRLFSVEK